MFVCVTFSPQNKIKRQKPDAANFQYYIFGFGYFTELFEQYNVTTQRDRALLAYTGSRSIRADVSSTRDAIQPQHDTRSSEKPNCVLLFCKHNVTNGVYSVHTCCSAADCTSPSDLSPAHCLHAYPPHVCGSETCYSQTDCPCTYKIRNIF